MPPQQLWPVLQANIGPQPPQLLALLRVSMQLPPHGVWPVGQVVTHRPAEQNCPVGQVAPALQVHCPLEQVPLAQWIPQVPQLAASLARLVHTLPQTLWPLGQVQTPLTQVAPLGQAWPQAPQFAASVFVFTSQPLLARPSQSAKPL